MRTKSNKELWWLTRVLSALIIVFFLFMFVGETFFGENPGEPMTNKAILQLSVFGTGLTGLVLAWKWELAGGIIALVAFVVLAIINPTTLQPSPLLLYPATAILFIVLWVKSKKNTV